MPRDATCGEASSKLPTIIIDLLNFEANRTIRRLSAQSWRLRLAGLVGGAPSAQYGHPDHWTNRSCFY